MQGFKLHPAAGFRPTDECCHWLYEKCQDWGVALMFHAGAQPAAPVHLDTQRPVFIAEAATRFPDAKFIVAHVAMGLWQEAVEYGRLIPNLYFDLSTHQMSYLHWGPAKFYEWVRDLIRSCGVNKILWATDSPLPTVSMATDKWVKVFTEPDTEAGTFTDEEIERIMWKNTAEVYGILR